MDETANDNPFAGLRALSSAAFPKRCRTCGRVYASEADFITRTCPPPHASGLKADDDGTGRQQVELYRNCDCGSTLLDFFCDRRDDSAEGERRRNTFARLMARLTERGVPAATARSELLVVARGGQSALVQRYIPDSRSR